MTDRGDIIYRVNDQDEIALVNEEWDRFAAANVGERFASAQVLQRSLWDFIIDPTTRELYRQVLKQIRQGRSLRFTFRCDSPTCRRLLEMHIAREEDGTVEFRTRTLSEVDRQSPILLESDIARSDELLRMCGWCKKVFVGDAWVEVEEAVVRLQLFEHTLLPSMTHGICEPCYQEMIETLAQS